MAAAHGERGESDRAVELLQEAENSISQLGRSYDEAKLLGRAAEEYYKLGRFETARRVIYEARVQALRPGKPGWRARVRESSIEDVAASCCAAGECATGLLFLDHLTDNDKIADALVSISMNMSERGYQATWAERLVLARLAGRYLHKGRQ